MTWINFRELREKLDFREVLQHYRIEIKAKNRVQHHGPCPLPSHQGQRKSTAFSANFDKGIWRCFGCGAQGNVIEFVAHMEGLNPDNPQELRRAAILIADCFGIRSERPKGTPRKAPEPTSPGPPRAVQVNAPLDFELKGLDPEHPYLKSRGFTAETIAHFELGYASRGLMQGRIAIPLRDPQARLIGYSGRLVDDSAVTEENPKYRFPRGRDRDGKRLEFSKALFLYHAHVVATPVQELFLVQGMPATWWLWQNGFRDTVALMGSSCSREQAELIVGKVPRHGRVWVCTDATKVGRYCAEEALRRVTPYRFCRWVELDDGKQPTDCSPEELRKLLG